MIKPFTQYLLESEHKTYDFKIKIANIEVDNDVMDKIEHALSAFDVASVSKAKHLPVTSKNLDFPNFDKCDVFLINVSLKYPCTDDQVRQVLGTQGRIPLANVVVIPKDQPEELQREEDDSTEDKEEGKEKKSILQKEIDKVTGGQVQVGQPRIDSMLKDLETRKYEFEKTEKVDNGTTNALPQNNKSPVTGRKGK